MSLGDSRFKCEREVKKNMEGKDTWKIIIIDLSSDELNHEAVAGLDIINLDL